MVVLKYVVGVKNRICKPLKLICILALKIFLSIMEDLALLGIKELG